MTGVAWEWQVRDRRNKTRTRGHVTFWGWVEDQPQLADEWAQMKIAALMYAVEPYWQRLDGWQVRLWCGALGLEVVACVDEWLAVLQEDTAAPHQQRRPVHHRRLGISA